MADFVTLTCPSCGGQLEISRDIDRFACAHCGREHLVNRSGGIVSLSPVIDALKKVGVGVDKTAAELAIVRLKNEITDLYGKRAGILQLHPRPATSSIFVIPFLLGGLLALVFYMGVVNAQDSSARLGAILGLVFGFTLAAVGGWLLFIVKPNTKRWDGSTGAQLKSLDELIAKKNAELQHAQEVVSL